MLKKSPNHATIVPVNHDRWGRVLGLSSLLWHSGLLVLLQTGWALLLFGGLYLGGVHPALGWCLLPLSPVWFFVQILLLLVYPEWPLNLLLCARLRRHVSRRRDRLVDDKQLETARVVEWVPRESIGRQSLETAKDLMLIVVDEDGIWMSGDAAEYALPKEAILSVEVETVRNSGWYTPSHMVVLEIRTQNRIQELMITYRDYTLGHLASRKRRREAEELAQSIEEIACGQRSIICEMSSPLPSEPHFSTNPYQPPGQETSFSSQVSGT